MFTKASIISQILLLNGLGQVHYDSIYNNVPKTPLVCLICNHHRLLPTSPCKHAHFSHACVMAKPDRNYRSFFQCHDCTFETIFRINYTNWTLCSSFLPLQGYDFLVFLVWLFGYSNESHF